MSVIDNLLNETSLNTVEKITMLDVDEIYKNPLNTAPIINVNELAASIKERGLESPLVVYKKSNHNYVIINGERRWTALKNLGIERVAAIIKPSPVDEVEERLMIMDANAQRDESLDYKKQRAKEYECLYHLLKQQNKIPTGMLKIEWIGMHMNVSSRTAQRYLEDKEKSNKDKKIVNNLEIYKDLENHMKNKLRTVIKFKKNSFSVQFKDMNDLNRILELLDIENLSEN